MKRFLPGMLLGAGTVLLLLFGSFQLVFLVFLAAGVIGGWEYCRMAFGERAAHLMPWLVSIVLLPAVAGGCGRVEPLTTALFLALLFGVCLLLATYERWANGFDFLCRLGFGSLWVGFGLGHIFLLLALPAGNLWLLTLLAVTGGADTGAYYIGRAFGAAKLCPRVSPGKTRAGAWGGLLAGVVAGTAVGSLLLPEVGFSSLVLLSILLVVVSVLGDLAESMIKRAVGVKDSGTLLAGHGGVLDRADSLLFTAPVLFYTLHFQLLASG